MTDLQLLGDDAITAGEIDRRLREAHDTAECVVGQKANKRLHIRGEECPATARSETVMEPKELAVIPPGHRAWCRNCAARYFGVEQWELPDGELKTDLTAEGAAQ